MRLLSLEVTNYRNIASARLEPGRELTVICGNNGQGKTNLLEAIWLLTGGKSFRGCACYAGFPVLLHFTNYTFSFFCCA